MSTLYLRLAFEGSTIFSTKAHDLVEYGIVREFASRLAPPSGGYRRLFPARELPNHSFQSYHSFFYFGERHFDSISRGGLLSMEPAFDTFSPHPYLPSMRRGIWVLLVLAACGCQNPIIGRTASDEEMFGPQTLRLQPTFTEVKDWTSDKKPDGIEAVIELQDQFGDPARATGTVVFELYSYRFAAPDPKGERVGGPWVGSLVTKDEQVAQWNSAIRGYSFQLADPNLSLDKNYVLTAEFDLGKRRLFDQVVIEGRNADNKPYGRHSVKADDQPPSH
jgi:hypothetical protein